MGRAAAGALAIALAIVPLAAGAADPAPTLAGAPAPKPAAQGVAVLGTGDTRAEAFALARAVYASTLRPQGLDELRARILAGDPPPPSVRQDVRDLAEVRASVRGDDAPTRRLLQSIGEQLRVQGLLVVHRLPAGNDDPGTADGGVAEAAGDAGNVASDARPGTGVVARLFLVEAGDFDAARYEPDPGGRPDAWAATIRSISHRFPASSVPSPASARPPPRVSSEPAKDTKPFYLSPWLWGAVGAAVLVGGFFLFASQDTRDDAIHVRMRVPR